VSAVIRPTPSKAAGGSRARPEVNRHPDHIAVPEPQNLRPPFTALPGSVTAIT
jgi:hypothetical protein